jgi:DNA-directed RNA polymerase specialized sigma54-like protein
MSYSLQQAADATGKNRSTIQRAIKNGRISAPIGESGSYEIDPAELHRVFPPVVSNEAQPVATQQNATVEIASENRELKAKVELLREMVEDLRERLDDAEQERRETLTKLTALLTYQQQLQPTTAPAPEQQPKQGATTERRGLGLALWGIVAVGAAATLYALRYYGLL